MATLCEIYCMSLSCVTAFMLAVECGSHCHSLPCAAADSCLVCRCTLLPVHACSIASVPQPGILQIPSKNPWTESTAVALTEDKNSATAKSLGTAASLLQCRGHRSSQEVGDVSILHTDSMKWTLPAVRGTAVPVPRHRHSAACARDKVSRAPSLLLEGLSVTTLLPLLVE